MGRTRRRAVGLGVAGVLLVFGIIVGLILQNVWLGVALALLVWLVWFLAFESRRGRNTGVNDEDTGIEL